MPFSMHLGRRSEAAHGNSLRALVMHLENITSEEIVKLEIATGDPLIYEYSNGDFVRVD